MEQHLGYAKHAPEGRNSGNSRNGKSSKKVRSIHGEIDLDIPRDRSGSFESKLIKKARSSSTVLTTGLSRCMREA